MLDDRASIHFDTSLKGAVDLGLAGHVDGSLGQVEQGQRRHDDTTKLTIYRIVQECLTNAFRHSGASLIAVEINSADSEATTVRNIVEVTVRDNGRGLGISTPDGFGLKAMRERVSALSGSFVLSGQREGGTSICVNIPAKKLSVAD